DADAVKVACSYCQGKGFASDEEDAGTWHSGAVAWRLRGLAASDSGDYTQAIAAFSAALELEPDFADVYYERGSAYLAAGRETEGAADLDEAARLSPKYAGPADEKRTEEKKPAVLRIFGWFSRKGPEQA